MSQHPTKFQRANVAASFDNQDAAEEALLDLRSVGLPDERIGYFSPGRGGHMVDGLAAHHRFGAAVLGSVIGGAVGLGLVYLLYRTGAGGPDLIGLGSTIVFAGMFFGGFALGLRGLWVEHDDAAVPSDAPFVMTVESGGRSGLVREILLRRGGHELHGGHLPA